MATQTNQLSEYNPSILPTQSELAESVYYIVVADWNSDITYKLMDGAKDTLVKHGVKEHNVKIVHVPGAFELTYASAKCVQKLKESNNVKGGVISIGCVIQGGTPHFDYICQGVTYGISKLNTEGTYPVVFGVLTTNNHQEALDRAGGSLGNKGVEAAVTAMQMAAISL